MSVTATYSVVPHGEPDVFETGDLPESEQKYEVTELHSDVVNHLKIDANSSRQLFSSKHLKSVPDRVDFSDRITASRRTGYIAFDAEEYTAGGEPSEGESVMARFQRLQCEISQLVAEVDEAKKAVQSDSDTGSSVSSMAMGMCRRLTDAHLQRMVGDNLQAVETRTEALAGGQSQLMQRLEAQRSKKTAPPVSDADPRASHVVYEMYSSVDKIKSMEQAKFTECEQRIQRLENLLGPPPPLPRFSLDSGANGQRSLVDAAQKLSSRVSVLCEGTFLEQMETRLGAVHAKLGQVTQKKEAVTSADTENKVAELFEMVKKWEAMIPVVPRLVDRLEAVKMLHEQALEFSQAISFIGENQTEAAKLMKQHKDTVAKLEAALSSNLATFQASSDAISARVKAVK